MTKVPEWATRRSRSRGETRRVRRNGWPPAGADAAQADDQWLIRPDSGGVVLRIEGVEGKAFGAFALHVRWQRQPKKCSGVGPSIDRGAEEQAADHDGKFECSFGCRRDVVRTGVLGGRVGYTLGKPTAGIRARVR